MEVCRRSSWLLLLLGVSLLAATLQGVQGEAESEGPSESECRPYIEKALKELETGESGPTGTPETGESKEDFPTVEVTTDDSDHQEGEGDDDTHEEGTESVEVEQNVPVEQQSEQEETQEETSAEGTGTEQEAVDADTTQEEAEGSQEKLEGNSGESDDQQTEEVGEEVVAPADETAETGEEIEEGESKEGEADETAEAESKEGEETTEGDETAEAESKEGEETTEGESIEAEGQAESKAAEGEDTQESVEGDAEDTKEDAEDTKEDAEDTKEEPDDTKEETDDTKEETDDTKEEIDDENDTKEQTDEVKEEVEVENSVEAEAQVTEQAQASQETQEEVEETAEEAEGGQSKGDENEQESVEDEEEEQAGSVEATQDDTKEDTQEDTKEDEKEDEKDETKEDDKSETQEEDQNETGEDTKSEAAEDDKSDTKDEETVEEQGASTETEAGGDTDERSAEKDDSTPDDAKPEESQEGETAEEAESETAEIVGDAEEGDTQSTEGEEGSESTEGDSAPEEELSLDIEIPSDLRDRSHVEHLLKLDEEASETEKIINRVAEITLKELKKLYENAIKPLEVVYKYRDLSNRHFGDAEIFSKPLILFMGPWSGGKSSIINYLLDNEYNETSLRTGAEPSPAYFNILMHGNEAEIWDGTQLAADFTFSGLQKFGQGLEERLRGVRLPNNLLEKVNIVEIPGILEVRKQVSRVFPFNDACQWFIDRADIIFLVYDPSKLDVGPETEAILDQLKGREHQTRIILNKADQVKPEELMRVQGALIWNISPLMSSAQPPVMYTTSLWSRPYESWAPMRLLQAQERAFLRDLRSAVDKRIENKIASARRFAVRVRNHAKMVDCYLTTYYNHKSVFGNRKQVADEIIEHPQDYHIYEGLSTLTNISRYDLPDPDVYRDFFKLNALYDFQQLSATCTYFRGCPINRLDVAIAYDLPELVGKHKRLVESALAEVNQAPTAPTPGS